MKLKKKSTLPLTFLLTIVAIIIAGIIVPGPIRKNLPVKVADVIWPEPIRESIPVETADVIWPEPIRESIPVTIYI